MSSVTCVICGARKGGANDWWVVFETLSGRAVWIGHTENGETDQPWKPATVPFHLCGVECLYRKLNALLLPEASAEKPSVSSGHPGPASQPIAPSHVRGILRIGSADKRTGSDSGARTLHATVAPNGKVGSPRLRENAAIGQGVTINGLIQSDEPLSVNGELTGTLMLPNHRLTVGPNGKVRANVHAREVEVFGMITGCVQADKVVIRKNARVVGDICTVTFVIEEGAFFEGTSTKAPGSDSGRQAVYHVAHT